MKKNLLKILIIVVAIFSFSPIHAESARMKETLAKLSKVQSSFTFAVMGDNRSGDRVYAKIIDRMLARDPLFVVNTGDVIPNPGNLEEWKIFQKNSKRVKIPYFLTPGNHDIDDKKSEVMWRDENDLPGRETYYSFSVGKNLFIVLNSCEPSEDRRISGEQLKWLEKVLSKEGYENKFVFLHHPLFLFPKANHLGGSLDRYPDLRDQLHKLFVDSKVDAVIEGHEHTFKRMEKDGVAYIICGGAGAPLYGKESFNHIMFINVDDKRVEAKVIDRDGTMRDEFLIKK